MDLYFFLLMQTCFHDEFEVMHLCPLIKLIHFSTFIIINMNTKHLKTRTIIERKIKQKTKMFGDDIMFW